jgi:hypothetical protein
MLAFHNSRNTTHCWRNASRTGSAIVFPNRHERFGIRVAVAVSQQRLSGVHDTLCDSIRADRGEAVLVSWTLQEQVPCVANASKRNSPGPSSESFSLSQTNMNKVETYD